MRGVDAALQCLQPVAFLEDLADMAAFCRNLRPGKFGRRRHLVGRAEIGPDEAAELDRRIGSDVDVLLELVLRRLVELVEAIAFDVEFPAVIDAPETAFLVASEEQGHPAMRAEFVDQADPAVAVAERDEILAEQLDADLRTVRLGDIRRQASGVPIPPHRLAHRRPGSDAGDQFVFLRWQHRRFLLAGSWRARLGSSRPSRLRQNVLRSGGFATDATAGTLLRCAARALSRPVPPRRPLPPRSDARGSCAPDHRAWPPSPAHARTRRPARRPRARPPGCRGRA